MVEAADCGRVQLDLDELMKKSFDQKNLVGSFLRAD